MFEHIRDVDAAIAEVARVLAPGGRFLFFLNHPLLQTPNSGWIDDQVLDPPEQYWRIGPYLVEDETIEEVEKGVFIPFIHRPLSRYVNALADAGLTLRRMEEPAPPPGFLARAAEYEAAATIPRLLFLRCEKAEARAMSEFVIITGLSGAGRSQAADDLEDLGWFVIDNLPTELIPKVVELVRAPGSETPRVALVVGRRRPPRRAARRPRRAARVRAPGSGSSTSRPAPRCSSAATRAPAAATRCWRRARAWPRPSSASARCSSR